MWRLFLAAAAVLLCCGILLLLRRPADQGSPSLSGDADERRVEIVGVVERVDGTPWADAKVNLVARLRGGIPELPSVDRLEAVSDSNGSFHARVLRAWRYDYIAWATDADQDSTYRTTNVQVGIHPVDGIRLQEEAEERMRVRLSFHPRETAIARHLTGVVSSLHVRGAPMPFEVNESGEAVLPPLPDLDCTITIRDEGGQFVLSESVPLGARARTEEYRETVNLRERGDPEAVAYDPVSPEWHHIELSDSPAVLIQVTTRDGVPIEGAPVYTRPLGGSHALVGTTDVRGRLAFRGDQSFGLSLEVRAERFVRRGVFRFLASPDESISQALANLYLVIDPDRRLSETLAEGEPDLILKLEPAVEIKGRLVLGDGRPVPESPIVVFREVIGWDRKEGDDSVASYEPIVISTDKAGRFSVPSLEPSVGFRIDVLLLPDVYARLKPTGEAEFPPYVWLTHGTTPAAGVADLGDLELTRLDLLRVRVRRQDGSVPEDPVVVLGGLDEQRFGQDYNQLMLLRVDGQGRASALVPRNAVVQIAASHGGEIGTVRMETTGAETAEVHLRSMPFIAGRIVSRSGIPLADARVHVSLERGGPLTTRTRRGPDGVTHQRQFGGPWETIYGVLSSPYLDTDDEGRFKVPALPGGEFGIQAFCDGYRSGIERVSIQDVSVDNLEIVMEKK